MTDIALGFVILTLEFHREGALWVGECRELGTATDGRSLNKVSDELARLVAIHIEGLEAVGERDHVLAERGVTIYRDGSPRTVERALPVSADGMLIQLRPVAVSLSPSSSAV